MYVGPIITVCRVRQNKTPQHENRNFSEMREYFLYQILPFSSKHNCPQIWCFMPYLLDVHQNDGNLNLKNKFCNWTNVDFSFQLGCDAKNHPICTIFSQLYSQGITHQ